MWAAIVSKVIKEQGQALISVNFTEGKETVRRDYRLSGAASMDATLKQLIQTDMDAFNAAYAFADTVILGTPPISSEFIVNAGAVIPGGAVDIAVNLYNRIGSIAGFQFDVTLPTGLTLTKAVLGKVSIAAAKQITLTGNRLLVSGLNQTILANGEVVILTVSAIATMLVGNYALGLTAGAATDAAGVSVPALYTGSSVRVALTSTITEGPV